MGNASAKNARRYSTTSEVTSKRALRGGPEVPAPPGKPILIPVASEDSQPDILGIRWERSPSNGGSAIIGYLVEHKRLGSPHWVRSSPNLCPFPELTLSGLEPGWRYQFRVRAQNRIGLSQPSELSDPLTVTLQRSAASVPRFEIELKDTVALENEQAEFSTAFSGSPIPKISWFKDGFEIFSSRRTRILTENGKSTLLIHQTALNDEGEIKCTATNRAGHVSTKAKLILEASPRIRLPRQYEDGLLFEQDETIRLKISVAGKPSPTVTWYHDSNLINPDDRHIIEMLDSGECSMKIPSANRKDRGEYTVKAVNKLGDDVASFLVTVTDRPAAPGKAIITMTLGRSVTLSWNEPDDDGGCKIGTYIVEYYRIGWDVWLKAATCRQPTTTLSELIEGSEYKFRVKAENPYGVSDPSIESDVIFIPDPKRGINSPPLRPDKTQSQREINRGRAERRNQSEPAKRTRSLTREEASRGLSADEFKYPPSRSTSAQRLILGPPQKPARADSRVTFSDTIYLHVEKPLEDEPPVAPVRPKSKRDKYAVNQEEKSDTVQMKDLAAEKVSSPPPLLRQQTFDDSGGLNYRNRRERSPSPLPSIRIQQPSFDEPKSIIKSSISLPREESLIDEEENVDEKFRGSSEFMLVLYPDEEDGKKNPLKRSASEGDGEEEDDDDLVPPPMSLSLPELFSADHQVVEVLREAVSSTELLHERAMERFYKALAAEEAESAKKNDSNQTQMQKEGLDFISGRLRSTRMKMKPPSPTPTVKIKRIQRRLSEGQTILKPTKNVPSSLLLPAPQLIASDPSLPKEDVEEYSNDYSNSASPTSVSLHRWDNKAMPLVPDRNLEETETKINQQQSLNTNEYPLNVAVEQKIQPDEVYDDYEESTDDGSEISDSSEDLKTLKSRLLAKPIVDEQDTYHPRGHPTPHIPSPEPEYKITVDNSNTIQPKSILKKRTEEEPVPVNRFGRPIPPEKPIEQIKTDDKVEPIVEPVMTPRRQSLNEIPDMLRGTDVSDSDNASLVNAAEVAKNRRRLGSKPSLEKKSSVEEKEDLEARMAVIDHYTEIVKEYAITHSSKFNTKIEPPSNKVNTNRVNSVLYSNQTPKEPTSNQITKEETGKKEEEVRSRKNSISSRGTTPSRGPTPARDDAKPRRKISRNESPAPRSRNVSNERSSKRSSSKTRVREPSQDRERSRSSSRTRKQSVPKDREVPTSRSSSRQRKEGISQSKSSSKANSRANSKDRFTSRTIEVRSSDSEPSQGVYKDVNSYRRLERSRRSSSKAPNSLKNGEQTRMIDEKLIAGAKINVASSMNYAIDLTLLMAAAYVYLFKKEIFAIPIIGLLLYRRIQEDIDSWIKKWWKNKPPPPPANK